jgi:hypothetical protein
VTMSDATAGGSRGAQAGRFRDVAASEDALLQAARSLFGQQGLDGTTIREIGQQAGSTPPSSPAASAAKPTSTSPRRFVRVSRHPADRPRPLSALHIEGISSIGVLSPPHVWGSRYATKALLLAG